MAATNRHTDEPWCNAKQCWRSVDAHFQNGVGSMLLSLWRINVAYTSFMNICIQSPLRVPKMQDRKSLKRSWLSFSGSGRELVSLGFDYKGSQCIRRGKWCTKSNILRLAVGYPNATINWKTQNLEPAIGTGGSGQTSQHPHVDGYRTAFGPPRSSRLHFWTGQEPNQIVSAVRTQTAGGWTGPVANTQNDHSAHRTFYLNGIPGESWDNNQKIVTKISQWRISLPMHIPWRSNERITGSPIGQIHRRGYLPNGVPDDQDVDHDHTQAIIWMTFKEQWLTNTLQNAKSRDAAICICIVQTASQKQKRALIRVSMTTNCEADMFDMDQWHTAHAWCNWPILPPSNSHQWVTWEPMAMTIPGAKGHIIAQTHNKVLLQWRWDWAHSVASSENMSTGISSHDEASPLFWHPGWAHWDASYDSQ